LQKIPGCSVQESQVRIGFNGLAGELDYEKEVPQAMRRDLRAILQERSMEDIVGSCPNECGNIWRSLQQKFELQLPDLKFLDKLLGEPDACLHLKLDSSCKFLDPIINKLTQKALHGSGTGNSPSRIRGLQDDILYTCELLPRALDILAVLDPDNAAEQKEQLCSSESLDDLLKKLRDIIN
jgi:hypothetical protein